MSAATWEDLRDVNRNIRQESDFKSCDGCICNFDIGDIYDVDGEQLCELCRSEREAENGGWISVKDRLPERRVDVLIRVTVGSTFNVEQGQWVGGYDWINCWCSGRNADLYPVTHWQPLPKPPQGKA